ncbi:MAG: hypothetical protein P9X22_07300 [Candidatus Zapsychrus exili]|nr:hypothetical protein [Candidatus Zapsychrus exili]
MKFTIQTKLLALLLVIFLSISCGKKELPKLTLEEAHQKFIAICKDEYGLDVSLKIADNTLWIYLPIDHPFYQYKASPPAPSTQEIVEKHKINKLDSEFKDSSFVISYDIVKDKIYPSKDPGYESKNHDEFSKKYRKIFEAILRSYFDLKESTMPGFAVNAELEIEETKIDSYVQNASAPEFFVIVIADITSGLIIEYTANLDDYRRYANSSLPYEEYSKRLLYDMRGEVELVGDRQGKNLKTYAISWQSFLSRQMKNRINFKYGRSQFPPSDDTRKEILSAVVETIRFYNFEDFDSVMLNNLRNETNEVVSKEAIKKLTEESDDPSVGKFHVIKFGL